MRRLILTDKKFKYFDKISDWMFQWNKDTPPINTPVADIKSLYDQGPEVFANDLNMVLWEMSNSFQYIIDTALPALKHEGVDISKVSAAPFLIKALKNPTNKEFLKAENINYISIFNNIKETYDAEEILKLDLEIIQQLAQEGLDLAKFINKSQNSEYFQDNNFLRDKYLSDALIDYTRLKDKQNLDCSNKNIQTLKFLHDFGLILSTSDVTIHNNAAQCMMYGVVNEEGNIDLVDNFGKTDPFGSGCYMGKILPTSLTEELQSQLDILVGCVESFGANN